MHCHFPHGTRLRVYHLIYLIWKQFSSYEIIPLEVPNFIWHFSKLKSEIKDLQDFFTRFYLYFSHEAHS